MDKVRLGLIGVGKGGRAVALSAKGLPEIELVALCSSCESTARAAAELYGVGTYYGDYRDMLEASAIDAVFIAAPNHLHCDMVLAAAEANKHVLCEKPMALTLGEADRMIEAAREHRVRLMVGFTERYLTPFAKAKDLIEAGQIGEPAMIHAKRAHKPRHDWVQDPEKSGGVLLLAGVHNIDLTLWLGGSTPKRLYAEMGSFVYKSDYTDNVALVMRLQNEAIVNIFESYTLPQKAPHPVDRRVEIIGTKGTLDIDMMKQPLVRCTDEELWLEDVLTWPMVRGEMSGAVREELREFARCIVEDREPDANGEAGRLSLAVALAAHTAFQERRVVDFESQ